MPEGIIVIIQSDLLNNQVIDFHKLIPASSLKGAVELKHILKKNCFKHFQ